MNDKHFWFLIYSFYIIIAVESTVITQCNGNNRVQLTKIIDDAITEAPHILIIKDGDGLLSLGQGNNRVTNELIDAEDALDVDYNYVNDSLYWSTRSGNVYEISLDETLSARCASGTMLRYSEIGWLPVSLAVDYTNGIIYVLDKRSNSIRLLGSRLNDDSYVRLAVIDVGEKKFRPTRIEIDASEGFIFLMDHGEISAVKEDTVKHILRMKLDGTDARLIDPPALGKEAIIGSITLDRINKRILVSSTLQRRIFSMNYDGKVLNTVLENNNGAISLSVTRDQLFWVNSFVLRNNTAHTDGSAYRCDYDPKIGCTADSIERIIDNDNGFILTIVAVEPESQTAMPITQDDEDEDPCPDRCSQICVRSSCVCQIGWKFVDGAFCQRIRDFFIYEDEGVIRSGYLDADKTRNGMAIAPFFADMWYKGGERTGFDYDPETRLLYYGGKEAIYRTELDTGARIPFIYQKGVFFGPLILDPITKNLYYTEIEQRGNVSFYIMKIASARPDIDPETSSSLLWEFGGIHTMALHPDRGYLYLSIFNQPMQRYYVLRLDVDAKNAKNLMALENSTFLSVDRDDDRVYMLSANSSVIKSSNLDGEDVRIIKSLNFNTSATGFLVRDDIIYIQHRTSIQKFFKTNGDYLGELNLFPYGQRMTVGLKIHEDYRKSSNDNPCAGDNGGCDNFCFAVPGNGTRLRRTCRCFDGVKCKTRT